jgi:hypothetical protein
MAGPNFVLDKGFFVNAAATVTQWRAAIFDTTSLGDAGIVGDTVKNPTAADTTILGVFQDTVDATKVATGKATANVRILGITRAESDGTTVIVPGDKIAVVITTGQFKKTAGAAGSGALLAGIAMAPAAAVAGTIFDLLLMPGSNV